VPDRAVRAPTRGVDVAGPVTKLGWKIVGGTATTAAGAAASRTATVAYRKIRKSEPPTNPANPHTRWAEAIGWAVLSGAVIGIGRLAAERLAARGWVWATGTLPPGMTKKDDTASPAR
jgi:Protein of unknown function (DUF4235)